MIQQSGPGQNMIHVVFEVSVQILMLDQVPSKSSRVLNLFPRKRRKISIKFQWDLLIFKTKLFLQQKKTKMFNIRGKFALSLPGSNSQFAAIN